MSDGWIYHLIIYLYALGLLFSTSHLFAPKRNVRRYSILFMCGVWVIQTVTLILWLSDLTYIIGYVDSFFIFSWALVSVYMLMNHFTHLEIFLFSAQVIGFLVIVSFHFFWDRSDGVLEILLLSKWIFLHVLIAMVSYAILSMSSMCAALYLITNHLLKQKKWNRLLRRLPSLVELESLSKRLLMVGLTLLCITILLGIALAYPTFQSHLITDPKIWGSVFVWVMYAIGWINHNEHRWPARQFAWWNVTAFLMVVLNYFLFNTKISFHNWI